LTQFNSRATELRRRDRGKADATLRIAFGVFCHDKPFDAASSAAAQARMPLQPSEASRASKASKASKAPMPSKPARRARSK
jgi:hypothetical protein